MFVDLFLFSCFTFHLCYMYIIAFFLWVFLCTHLSLHFPMHFFTKFFGSFFSSPHSFLCFCLLSRFVNDDVAFVMLLLFLYVSLLVILFVSMFFHFVAFVSLLSFSKHLFMLLCCIFFHGTLFECCLYIAMFVFPSTFDLFLCCCELLLVFLFFFIAFCFSFIVQDYSSLVSSSFLLHFILCTLFFCATIFLFMLHLVLCTFHLCYNSSSLFLSTHNFSLAHRVLSFIFFWI
jgi:hypothetical protein